MQKPMLMVTLSDVHIGVQSVMQISKEFFDDELGFFTMLNEVYEYCIEEDIVFGGVAITGDLFDHQLSLNSQHTRFAMNLIHELALRVVKEYKGKVIILKGTRSHDLDQLNIFEPFIKEYEGNFFIYNTVTKFELNGYKCLAIPEEYMTNQEEYYADYFKDKYDIILGHGFFKFNCFDKNEIERPMPSMPIFDQEEFVKMSRVTIFGHDHTYKSYRDSIYYNGSFSRLQHGMESNDMGGLILTIDKNSVEVDRLVNNLAPIYRSVSLEDIVKGEMNFENAVNSIKNLKKKIDFLKVKISKDLVETNPTLVTLLSNLFSTQYKRLGIVIDAPIFVTKNGESVLLLKEQEELAGEDNAENLKAKAKYDYLFDSKISKEEKIKRFINQKFIDKQQASDISIDDIRDMLSEGENDE